MAVEPVAVAMERGVVAKATTAAVMVHSLDGRYTQVSTEICHRLGTLRHQEPGHHSLLAPQARALPQRLAMDYWLLVESRN